MILLTFCMCVKYDYINLQVGWVDSDSWLDVGWGDVVKECLVTTVGTLAEALVVSPLASAWEQRNGGGPLGSLSRTVSLFLIQIALGTIFPPKVEPFTYISYSTHLKFETFHISEVDMLYFLNI
jgi:hypothetical protein